MDSLQKCMVRLVSSAYCEIFCSLLPILIPLIFSFSLMAIANVSTAIINKYGDSGHPCLTPLSTGKWLLRWRCCHGYGFPLQYVRACFMTHSFLTLGFISYDDVYITNGVYIFIINILWSCTVVFLRVSVSFTMYLVRDDLINKWNQCISCLCPDISTHICIHPVCFDSLWLKYKYFCNQPT